jgi:hypothetical protein
VNPFIQLRNTLNGQTNINKTLIKSFCASYNILHIMYISYSSYGLTYVHCTVLSVAISISSVFCMDLWKVNKMNEWMNEWSIRLWIITAVIHVYNNCHFQNFFTVLMLNEIPPSPHHLKWFLNKMTAITTHSILLYSIIFIILHKIHQ